MFAGAVRAGGAGAGHRDVRQRRQIAQGPARSVQLRGQLAVDQPGADGDGRVRGVDLDHPGQAGQGNEITGRIGEPVERMAGAERPDLTAAGHQVLQLGY